MAGRLRLRPLAPEDEAELLRIHATPEVARWWDAPGAGWHASVDLFLDPALHNRGHGTGAVRRVVRMLIDERGHHRVTIDPAAANTAAIRAYEKAGLRPVGVMRRYERDADGRGWHDGILMELVVAGGDDPPD